MYGLWCAGFGQDAEAFWRATPAQWYAIYDAHLEESSRALLAAGTITATLLNVNRGKRSAKVYGPADIFPSLKYLERPPSLEKLKRMAITAFGARRRKP